MAGCRCMNDEATTHYAGIINQMTEGALFAVEQLKNRSTVCIIRIITNQYGCKVNPAGWLAC